jgi:hypothetical protein
LKYNEAMRRRGFIRRISLGFALTLGSLVLSDSAQAAGLPDGPNISWHTGRPIVSYWCGPTLTDAVAQQMAEGGWNLVWCNEQNLDVAQRHGLRAQIQDELLTPATLDDPKRLQQLDALIERVRKHPAMYAYYVTDEPSAAQFPGLGKLVHYLRQRDPAHLAYINLFPTYANNDQLGTKGDAVTAYREYLQRFVAEVKPALLSYDHYQFSLAGDNPDYFLNLEMVRRASLEAGVPFLNIVQASTWAPKVMRVPGAEEMRFLVYTTLAYGAQGISYYIYSCANHLGGIANADGTPTELYLPLQKLNREFTIIASQLQSLHSVGVYHAGMLPPGAVPLPADSAIQINPSIPPAEYKKSDRAKGVLLGCFGVSDKNRNQVTHAVVVNLDYKNEITITLRGAAALEVFDAANGKWSGAGRKQMALRLEGGSGKLVRLK